jgi:spore coat protein U-like protein
MIRRFALASAILIAAASATPAMAASQQTNLSVSSTVPANCTISTTAIDYGNYDPISANTTGGADVTGSGTITYTCTSGTTATITLDQGSNSGAGSTDASPVRRLTDGDGNSLGYQLYTNIERTTVWGNTGGTGLGVTGNGSAQGATVYGKINNGQNAAVGTYSDTVTATITY